jgi:hypothetical protein
VSWRCVCGVTRAFEALINPCLGVPAGMALWGWSAISVRQACPTLRSGLPWERSAVCGGTVFG